MDQTAKKREDGGQVGHKQIRRKNGKWALQQRENPANYNTKERENKQKRETKGLMGEAPTCSVPSSPTWPGFIF